MAYIPQLQRMPNFNEQEKENIQPRLNRVNVSLSRHCRVQSTLALNLRKQDKSNTQTSFNNISLNDNVLLPVRQSKPLFKVQRSSNGDLDHDLSQIVSTRQVTQPLQPRASNSLGIRLPQEAIHLPQHNRMRTESTMIQPLRTLLTMRVVQPNVSYHNLSLTNISNNTTVIQNYQSQKPHNPQSVTPYAEQIIEYLKDRSKQEFRTFNAFKFQKEITERMRSILLDWIVDVHMKFKLQPETLFLTNHLIDRTLEVVQIDKSKLQLYGVAALFIACKYEEVYATPHVRDLAYLCDNAFSKQEILQAESVILESCQFNLLRISPWRFLSSYQEFFKLESRNYFLTRYIIELAIIDFKTNQNTPNILASAAIYLVNKIRKIHPSWNEENIRLSSLLEVDIRPCAKELCQLLQNSDKKYFSSIKKKYAQPSYMEVSKIRIEKKPQ